MFSEILKIIPNLDKSEMDKLEKNMSSRFTRIAKRFGKGIGNVFKGGGWVGAAVALLDKILNPLKTIQESMDKTLSYSSQVVSNAEQFGTTAGRLARLQALGQAKGIDQDQLFNLISKFQVAVANAEANPNEPSAVRNYVGQTDMAAGFFQFIQNLKAMEKNQQILAQQSVFGEKQILKIADFLNTDFQALIKEMSGRGLRSAEYYDKTFQRGNKLSGLSDTLEAVRGVNEHANRSAVMTQDMMFQRDKSEKERLERENEQITAYKNLAAVSDTVAKIEGAIQKVLGMIGELIEFLSGPVNSFVETFNKFLNSSWLQRAKNYFGGKGGK